MLQQSDEVDQLRRCVRDLVAITALPAVWAGASTDTIQSSLVDALFGTLRPDVLYLRIHRPGDGNLMEAVRVRGRREGSPSAREIGAILEGWLDSHSTSQSLTIQNPVADGTLQLIVTPIGYAEPFGIVAAASDRYGFPSESDRLLLQVAANQAAIALHNAERVASRDRVMQERAERLALEQTARAESEHARHEVERALGFVEVERQRLRELFSRIPAAVVVTRGPDHAVEFSNPLAERMIGGPARKVVGRSLRDGNLEFAERSFIEFLNVVYQTGRASFIAETYLSRTQRAKGVREGGHFNLACLPMRSNDGQVEGVLIHAVDVTEQVEARHQVETLVKQLTSERAELQRLLIDNARLYDEFRGKAALEERQRLARELHDSVSQALYGIALNASAAEAVRTTAPDRLSELLDEVVSLADAALAEMRALIFELRPESLQQEGLVAALQKQAAAVSARHGIETECALESEPALPLAAKEALYRIAQEALQNAVKHSGAQKGTITLRQAEGVVVLCVEDDGGGFEPKGDVPGHFGLRSMRERAVAEGGHWR